MSGEWRCGTHRFDVFTTDRGWSARPHRCVAQSKNDTLNQSAMWAAEAPTEPRTVIPTTHGRLGVGVTAPDPVPHLRLRVERRAISRSRVLVSTGPPPGSPSSSGLTRGTRHQITASRSRQARPQSRATRGDALWVCEWIPALWGEITPNATSAGTTVVRLAREDERTSRDLAVGLVLAHTERARCPRSQVGEAATVPSTPHDDPNSAAVDHEDGSRQRTADSGSPEPKEIPGQAGCIRANDAPCRSESAPARWTGPPPEAPVTTTRPLSTSLRGVIDDGKRTITSLVSRSKHKHAETRITERRGNLRAPGHPRFGPRAVSTPVPIPVNEEPGSHRLPRRSVPLRDTGGGH